MGLGTKPPEQMFGTKVNSSVYGLPYSVVMGTAPVPQQILWIDGFSAVPAPAKGYGGKGGGGKNGQFIYSADVVVALCNGPIVGVGDVWSGQSWLGSPKLAETYTIASGSSYSYTPVEAGNLNNDLGVGVTNTYSSSNNDLGAPAPTVLSGSFLASLKFVAWGAGQTPSTLTTGHYSINPATGAYVFSNSDNGRAVTVNYSYNVTNVNRQETDIVPAGQTITVTGGTGTFINGDGGVTYPLTGVAFTKVASGPTTGQYYVTTSGSSTDAKGDTVSPENAIYHFAAGDINALVTITYSTAAPTALSAGETTVLNFTLNNGTKGQSPYSFLTASYPDAAFGYTGVATNLFQPMDLGMGGEIQQNRFEIITADAYGSGIQDCNPVQCIYQVLTNSMWGLGVGTVPFPTACLDNGGSGTWGGAAPAGTSNSNNTAWNWFAAQNFFISPTVSSQNSAASEMSKWLEAGMCAAFYSEGLLKLRPYGDTSAAANGVTWTAPTAAVVALDDTTFVGKEGEDPLKISRVSAHDAWNVVQVQWNNRLNQYAPEITQESDQGLINRWGERREDPQNWDFIHTVTAATFAANMRVKHNGYTRNTYEFALPYSYAYLEPMDIVEISATSFWAAGLNNTNLGINTLPVRITKIVDDPAKGLQITAEDYNYGAHLPVLYNKQLNDSTAVADVYADPGNSEVVMFEATNRITGYAGDQIWIGALGASNTWGSTNIWVSQTSGGTYKCIGSIKTPARLGTLHSTFAKTLSGSPAAYDPDYTDTLVVDLAENCAMLDAGSDADADAGNTMCFVDGEIVSYSALTYTGQNQITMGTYLRRGQYGSTISSHATNSLFLRLDGSIFKYTYDPAWRGVTLYFKFQSVNFAGNMAQDLSTLTPTSFTLPGTNQGSIDASSGLAFETTLGTNASYRPLSNPLTAIDNGTAPEVDIASFSMQVAGTTVSYNSGSVTGTVGEYGQTVFIYFSDPPLAGGTVTYNLSTTRETSISGSTNFFLGSIQFPNSGGGNTVGNNDGGTGGQYSRQSRVLGSTTTTAGDTWTNPGNVIDNDTSTYGSVTTATGDSGNTTLVVSGYPQFTGGFSTDVLKVVDYVQSLTGSGAYLVEYSTNGGTGWTALRTASAADSSAVTTTVSLPSSVNTANVQVRFTVPGGGGTGSASAYAGTGANDASSGTAAWSNPTNPLGSSGASSASATAGSTQGAYANSEFLKLTNYSFSLPNTATVKGIIVTTKVSSNSKSNVNYSRDVYDNAIKLYKAGTLTGSSHVNYNDWPTTPGTNVYGSSTDLWGGTWLYSDINNAGFGVGIQAGLGNDYNASFVNATGYVWSAEIQVWYTIGSACAVQVRVYDASQVVTT